MNGVEVKRRLGFSIGVGAAVILGVCTSLGAIFAKRVVTPAKAPETPVKIVAINRKQRPHTVSLTLGEDATLPGKYSFIFDNGRGHLRLGDVIRTNSHEVERILLNIDSGVPRLGVRGRVTGWWYTAPEDLGFPVEHIEVGSSIGHLPAWLIHPDEPMDGAFAIHVHGRGAMREEVLRGVLPLARLGVTNIVMTYRNDSGAIPAADGRYGLGTTESCDVEDAIAHAVSLGATRITLFGWSMGGTAVLLAAEQSVHRNRIKALILDSPAVDWPNILKHQATRSQLPGAIGQLGMLMMRTIPAIVGLQRPILVNELNPVRFSEKLRVPVLLHVSAKDTFVPSAPALRFAALRDDLVTLNYVSIGEHVKLWNVDPVAWEEATESFMRRVIEQG